MKLDADGLVHVLDLDKEKQIYLWDHIYAVEFPGGISQEVAEEILRYSRGFSVRPDDLEKFVTEKMASWSGDGKWDWILCSED